jgi:1,3-beta-glucanosyltransferase GAS5
LPIFLSEWGCIENGRDFGEMAALMSSQMTSVYSGGLLYEYALEPNNFGIVSVSGSQASELPDFGTFKSALAANPAPTGNGGFTSATSATACPTKDAHWRVEGTGLPAIPDGARKFLEQGAGPGPGLKGGSQNAGGASTGTAQPGSGSVTGTKNAAPGGVAMGPMDWRPLYVSGVAMLFTMLGACLL